MHQLTTKENKTKNWKSTEITNKALQLKPVYRGMIEDYGKPALGARKLGVRQGTDLTVSDKTAIHDKKEISTSPDSPLNLPKNWRPAQWGGTGKDPVWEIETSTLNNGTIEWFEDKPGEHGIVRPVKDMPYTDFKSSLESTQSSWKKKEK